MNRGEQNFDYFDELRTVSRTNIFQIKSIYGVSAIRDLTVGTVTQADGEYLLQNAGNGDETILDTAERGPYQTGYTGEPGAGLRLPSAPTGQTKIEVGLVGGNDGFYFFYDAIGLWRAIRRNGSESAEQIAYWNDARTKVVTIGQNEIEIDPMQGHIYQIPYSWYAFGPSRFNFQITDEDPGNKRWIKTLAQYKPTNGTSVTDPQQPVRVRVTTGAGDPAYTVYVGGRQYSILGPYDPIYRETSIEKTVTSVTDAQWFPAFAIRRASVTPYALTKLSKLFLRASGDIRVLIENNGSVPAGTYATPTDYDASETLLEVNTAPGSTFGSGITLQKIPYYTGTPSNPSGSGEDIERLPLIEDQPQIVYVRRFDGESTGIDVDITATFREDF